MKKIITYSSLVALAALLFTSCSNSSKLAFNKRHYRSGIFHDFIGNNKTASTCPVAGTRAKDRQQMVFPVIAKTGSQLSIHKPIDESVSNRVITQKTITAKKFPENNLAINSNAGEQNITTPTTNISTDVANSAGDSQHSRDNISVPFVVIVLCAIFIPPLGVGLMYGINSYFWIDLILTLLFFFPGMLFALIVVLM